MRKAFLIIGLVCLAALSARAQTAVSVAPVARQQFFTASGVPLAGGLIYTYASGTSTPQATFTDFSGTTQNTNPIVLDAGGMAQIWLAGGETYRFVAKDALGVQQWLVDGVVGSPNLLSPGPIGTTTPNVVETTELLTASSTPALTGLIRLASGDQICWRNNANSADGCLSKDSGDVFRFNGNPFAYLNQAQTFTLAQTFSAAVNLNAGGALGGIFTGTPTFSGNVIFSGVPAFGSFTVSNSSIVDNLNANFLQGATWSAPGAIGAGTPNTVVGTTLSATTHVNDASLAASSSAVCTDASKNLTTSGCVYENGGKLVGGCTTAAAAFATCTDTVTFFRTEPDTNYAVTCSGIGPTGFPWIQSLNSKGTGGVGVTTTNGSAAAALASSFSEIDCTITR